MVEKWPVASSNIAHCSMSLDKAGLTDLPRQELARLKGILLEQFPLYRRSPFEFEEVWESCIISIPHLCKRLRLSCV